MGIIKGRAIAFESEKEREAGRVSLAWSCSFVSARSRLKGEEDGKGNRSEQVRKSQSRDFGTHDRQSSEIMSQGQGE